MITRWIEDIKKTPSLINERREQFSARRKEFTTQARTTLKHAAGDSQERLWTLGTSALERVDSALERSETVPVVGTLSKGAHKVVSDRLDRLTSVPVDGYDALNAREVVAAVKGLDSRISLASVRRHELQNKNRKTVLAAIDDRVSAL